MSDNLINRYTSQGSSYESQVASLTQDLATGKIDADGYLNQLKSLELANLQSKSDVESKTVQLESPSDKALGELKGLGLEALLQFITGENRTSQMKSAESRIENNKQAKEANFQQKMAKIEEAIKKAEEQEKASWWKKAFGWISTIVTAILSVTAIVAGAMTGNPLLIGAGIAGLYFATSGAVEQATGKGLTTRILEGCGVSPDKAALAGMIIDTLGSIITGIITGAGLAHAIKAADIGAKASVLVARLTYGTSIASGLASVGSGTAGGFSAYYKYGSENLKADELELKKAMEKLLMEDQESQKLVKRILEFFQTMTDDVNQIVKDKTQTTVSVMSMTPSGGMA